MKNHLWILLTAAILTFTGVYPLIAQDTLYFDPGNADDPNQDGSIAHPYDNLEQVTYEDNTVYLLKRGTTMEFEATVFTGVSDVVLNAYGSGARPRINTTQISIHGCDGFKVKNLDIFATRNILEFDGEYDNRNIEIRNCLLHSGDWDRFNFGIKGTLQDLTIVDCEIYNIYKDGIYLSSSSNIHIENCYIHDINKQFLSNPDGSSGDCAQFIGCSNITIRNCIFDRSKTGKKFCLIFTEDSQNAVIEDCHFIGPKDTEYGGASLHAGGFDFVVRRNIFENAPTGIFNHASNMLIHYNQFIGNTRAIYFASDGEGREIFNNVFYNNELGVECWLRQASIINNATYLTSQDHQAYHIAIDVFSNNLQNIEGVSPHEDAIIADPLFVDHQNFNFHLQSGSPCIDAAQDLGLTKDFDRNPVPCNGVPDIGAFEYQENCNGGTNQRPIADAGSDTTVFAGDTVQLSGEGSYDPDNDSLRFRWRAPSPIVLNNSTVINPFFTAPRVNQDTVFTLSLTVDDGGLKSEPDQVEVTVNTILEACFQVQPDQSKPYTASVDASCSTPTSGQNITGYEWDFGDNTTATGLTASHTYDGPGNYDIELMITDNGEASDTSTQQITLERVNVQACFEYNIDSTDLLKVYFDAGCTSPPETGTIEGYSWLLGDGSQATGKTTSHSYGQRGDYSVSLQVTTNHPAVSDTTTKTIQISDTVNALESKPRESRLEVFPNPSSGIINILLKDQPSREMVVNLLTTEGKILSEEVISISGKRFSLNLSQYPAGIYILQIRTKRYSSQTKIYLQKMGPLPL